MVRVNFIIYLLIFTAFCSCNQRHSKKISSRPVILPTHKISSIKNIDSVIKIDEKVIYFNKNLGEFISDLQQSSLSISYQLDTIPHFIKSFLEAFSSDHFTIANPGKNWNCCCDWDESRPNRQLICHGKSRGLFFISYLTGGIGVSQHLILKRYYNKTITDFWTGTTLNGNLQNKEGIIKYLATKDDKHPTLNI